MTDDDVQTAPEDGRTEPEQVWEQEVGGRLHRVEASGSVRHRVRWLVGGVEVATKASTEEKIRLRAADTDLLVVHSMMGKPQRASVAGTDLRPEPGSAAAGYEQRVLDHPTRYSLLAGLGGVGKVVLPIVGVAVVTVLWRLVRPLLPGMPDIPWPDLPDLPDLPSIPWPDLPSIPWPDLPDLPDLPELPGWLVWVLDNAHYIGPVVVALVLARLEIRRRRTQDERRRRHEDDPGPTG